MVNKRIFPDREIHLIWITLPIAFHADDGAYLHFRFQTQSFDLPC